MSYKDHDNISFLEFITDVAMFLYFAAGVFLCYLLEWIYRMRWPLIVAAVIAAILCLCN